MERRAVLTVLAVIGMLQGPAEAELLGTARWPIVNMLTGTPQFFGFTCVLPPMVNDYAWVIGWRLTPDSLGHTYYVGPDRAHFDEVAAMLTNGRNSTMYEWGPMDEFIWGIEWYGENFFDPITGDWHNLTPGDYGTAGGIDERDIEKASFIQGPDFQGYRITQLEATRGTVEDPHKMSIAIYGVPAEPVPLPAAALLGAIGLGVTGWRLRRQRSSGPSRPEN